MSCLLSVLLITVGALLAPAEGQDYNQLPDLYKKGIDLAIQHFNNKRLSINHVNFFSNIEDPKIEQENVYFNFYLKATHCINEYKNQHQPHCHFRSDRPLIDCVLCGRRFSETLDSPFIHCVLKRKVSEEKEKRVRGCSIHLPGSSIILASKGCEGCY